MEGSVRQRDAHVAVRLDRELIVQAAQRVLEAEGLGRLTMRRIRARAFAVAGDDSFAAYCFYGDPAAHVAA